MFTETKKPKTLLATYWITWIVILAVAIGSIFTLSYTTAMPQRSQEIIFFVYFGICALFLAVTNYMEGKRLVDYLRDNHPEGWKSLITIPGINASGRNDIRMAEFLRSTENFEDQTVSFLKQNYLRFRIFFWTVFASIPAVFFLIFALRFP